MIAVNTQFRWDGEHAKEALFDAAWENLARVVVYFHTQVMQALNTPNSGIDVPTGKGGKKIRVYLNPSKPGQPPHKITGWGQRHVQYALDKASLKGRVGLVANALYMLWLEMGVAGGKIIRPKSGKALRFFSKREGKFVFRKRVAQGAIAARPWLLATLRATWTQLATIAAGGQSP